jgi:hypothetical protein
MVRAYFKNIISTIITVSLLSACVKDKPAQPDTKPPAATEPSGNVYTVCEGSLGNGNSTLYLYNYKSSTDFGNIYESVNAGSKLGDVFQSIIKIGNKWFLCINNSDKILVLDTIHKQIGSINVPKPRYVLPISETKAYVSTLFSNKVYIINPQSMSVTGIIEMPYQNPEFMVMRNNKAYISTWDTACGSIYTVDIATDKIQNTIVINNRAPHGMAIDKHGNLWVVSGNVYKGKSSAITVLNAKDEVVRTLYFPAKADVIKPVFNTANDVLYFIEVDYNGGTEHNGIYRMGVNDTQLPQTPFVAAQKFQYFWALGIEPKAGNVYVGDPKGFVQKGSVMVYDDAGKQINNFSVGVGPGSFYFD